MATDNKKQDFGVLEIVAICLLVVSAAQKYVLPFIIQLKNDFLKLLSNWIFDGVIFVVLLISIKLRTSYLKRKAIRKAIEEEESRKFWEKVRKEEEAKKEFQKLYEPKPRPEPVYVEPEYEEPEEPEEKIEINVDLSKVFYKQRNLNIHEINYLIKQGYQEISYKSMCTKKKEDYLLKPRFNESLNHMIVIYDLAEYLDKKNINYEMYTTRMPDLVLYFGRRKVAFEVETGTVMTNMKKFREKLKLLEENYGENWYFIVTNRNKVKQYKKYGKVIDPRYIKGQVDKIIKKAKKNQKVGLRFSR